MATAEGKQTNAAVMVNTATNASRDCDSFSREREHVRRRNEAAYCDSPRRKRKFDRGSHDYVASADPNAQRFIDRSGNVSADNSGRYHYCDCRGKSGAATLELLHSPKCPLGVDSAADLRRRNCVLLGHKLRGQLGDGTTTYRLTPTKVSTDIKFASIASGTSTTCELLQLARRTAGSE